jgi:PIN domain nuclease of toxin-antitoxin system
MRFLLDTHVMLWLAFEDSKIPSRVRKKILTPASEAIVSAASAWEIATKYRLGRLDFARKLVENFTLRTTAAGYTLLAVSVEHALRAGQLPGDHKDPFDRMLAAQAIHENIPIISNDPCFDRFAVRREW